MSSRFGRYMIAGLVLINSGCLSCAHCRYGEDGLRRTERRRIMFSKLKGHIAAGIGLGSMFTRGVARETEGV